MTSAQRDIRQIAISPGEASIPDRVYALAFDGSLWVLQHSPGQGWRQLPYLPPVIDTTPAPALPVPPGGQ